MVNNVYLPFEMLQLMCSAFSGTRSHEKNAWAKFPSETAFVERSGVRRNIYWTDIESIINSESAWTRWSRLIVSGLWSLWSAFFLCIIVPGTGRCKVTLTLTLVSLMIRCLSSHYHISHAAHTLLTLGMKERCRPLAASNSFMFVRILYWWRLVR